MERIYTKSLLTIFLLLCSLMAIAHDFEVDGIYYDVTDTTSKTIAVTYNKDYKYTGAVTIPENVRYNGNIYKVTTIENMAFWKCCDLTSVTIPNSVTTIGHNAFEGCSSLTSISIPNSVTTIGRSAFTGCTSLTSITISNSVTSIEHSVLVGCSNLESIVVESGNTRYDSRNNCNAIIETATNTLVAGYKNTIIPNSVTGIGQKAFNGCEGLTDVTIPNNVTSIGEWAFSGRKLASITFLNGITSIESYAFAYCTDLTSIKFPNSVTTIGRSAFTGCTSLTSITIPNSVTSIERSALVGCSNLESIVVESGNTKYDSRNNCNAIIETATNTLVAGCKNTIIPNSVTEIGDWAFGVCEDLTSIIIPNSITKISNNAFVGCNNLGKIYIKAKTPTIIDNNAFYNCYTATLYIYTGTKEAYQSSNGWKNFSSIIEIDEFPR